MKKLLALSLLLVSCSSPTAPDPTPEFEEQHALPHAGPCHVGESQGWGVMQGQCVAL